ncbi:hypothetical protein PIB30_087177, partial [Stylosanthes scabra]|nr:hypothetical protein [Stylosanthes scabra]
MESGKLMLRVHDECLVLNIYKSMRSSSGAKTYMKINSVDPASTKPPDKQTNKNKAPKKEPKEEK